jgi:hypothetical protein
MNIMNHFIEIRTLNLKPGTRDEFHRLYIEEALPLLQRWGFDVVAHGPSLHDENTYYVIRRYKSLSRREQMEDAYYASDDWRKGPREAMLALIEFYTDIVLELDEVTVNGLRGGRGHFVEVRSYDLKPGTREEYHRLFLEEAMPILKRFHVDVVAYGPSLHAENSCYLMRRFDSLVQREQSEESFYGSDEWRKGPRQAVLACIENYSEVVFELDEVTVNGLRKDGAEL